MVEETYNLTSFQNHSEEVQDIFGRPPKWYLKWGITSIFLFVSALILGCSLIKYPDIIPTRITLTTEIEPVNLVSRVPGKIRFLVSDSKTIEKGDILAYTESAVNPNNVEKLKLYIKQLIEIIKSKKVLKNITLGGEFQLGELQSYYLQLSNSVNKYNQTYDNFLKEDKSSYLRKKIDKLKQLNTQLLHQKQIQEEELLLNHKKFVVEEGLFKQKVIADLDLDKTKLNYLQVKRQYETFLNSITSNEIAISELDEEVKNINIKNSEELEGQLTEIYSFINDLQSKIQIWEFQYLFIAPYDGIMSILNFYTNDQYLNSGTEVLTILPKSFKIYGQVYMPISGSGKVEIGQNVRIKLDNYPYAEYGVIIGKVDNISLIPVNNMYTIRIILPMGLRSNLSGKIGFKQKLSGSADIITKDLSVLDRVIFKFRSLI